MAMGDRIDCPVGGVVETTLQLDFRKAQVAQLGDAPNFRFVTFSMLEPKKGKEDQRRVRPGQVEVTEDDQKVSVRWSFNNQREIEGDTPFFVEGDEWQLQMAYVPSESTASAAPPERRFTLGTVKLTKP